MRTFSVITILSVAFSGLLFGQTWEVGAAGGYGFYRNLNVNSGSANGSAGFGSGLAAGALLGNNINRWLGGEVRYTYQIDDLQVSSGSAKATASAQSHALHYDFLFQGSNREVSVRPFLAAGAGVKFYRGTGAEPAYQPLSGLVVLTHASEAQPLLSFGGGAKFKLSRHALLRLDIRDYATPVPSSLLAAPPGSRIGGWVHDLVFLVGVSEILDRR